MQDNDEVARGLEEIAGLLAFAGEAKFRVKAYQRAAAIVRTVGPDLGHLVEQDRLTTLEGIGAALSRQIQEIWNTGGSAYLSGLRSEHPEGAAELITRLLEATGTVAHVEQVRARLDRRGVARNTFASEAALYAAIDIPAVPPELRSGQDELAAAARGDFADLITLEAVRGAVHCHTHYSDGKNSVLEMASAAHARGMSYITITDHSPSAHYAGGVPLDRLKQQWDEIAAAQEQVPIRILRGTESDILADGRLDYPDEVLEQFDVIIASIHARHRLDRAAMTERLVRALSWPVFEIWGHALGRILQHRAPIDCDVPRVLDALARSRGAVEVNADPHRLDLPSDWIRAARERGIPLVLSVDAHSTRGLDVLRYGVTTARRGGALVSEVLNALRPDEFARRVRPC